MFYKFNFRLWLFIALITNIYSSNLNTDLNNTEKKIVESKEANLEANLKIDGNKSKDKSKASLDGYKKVNNKENKKPKLKKSKFPTSFEFTKSSNLKGKETDKKDLYKIESLEEQIKCRLRRGKIIYKRKAKSNKKDFGFCTKEVDIPLANLTNKVVIKDSDNQKKITK